MRVNKCNLGSYAMVGSVIGKEVYAAGDLFIKTTIDTDSSLEVDGLVVAGEGIMGDGSFMAKAAIANEYFEFSGKNNSKVFEISEMEFTEVSASENDNDSHGDINEMTIENAIDTFNKVFDTFPLFCGTDSFIGYRFAAILVFSDAGLHVGEQTA